jgi:uncharacterized protein
LKISLALYPFILVVAAGWFAMGSVRFRERVTAAFERQPLYAFLPALGLLLLAAFYQVLSGDLVPWLLVQAAIYWTVPLLCLGLNRRGDMKVAPRDLVALALFFLPIHLRWFVKGSDLVDAIPAASVPLGLYYGVVVRGMPDPGYTWRWKLRDFKVGLSSFLLFGLVALPLGLAVGFIHYYGSWERAERFPLTMLLVFAAVALPEEMLFRGYVLRAMEMMGHSRWKALVVSALLFGVAHWNHPPVPNWRYVILASLAGLAYGYAYLAAGRRLPAAAFAHALVDTTWYLFFMEKSKSY